MFISFNISIILFTYTVVAKIIKTLVFSPAKKNGLKSVISIFCWKCVCRKYQFTFPNINFAATVFITTVLFIIGNCTFSSKLFLVSWRKNEI